MQGPASTLRGSERNLAPRIVAAGAVVPIAALGLTWVVLAPYLLVRGYLQALWPHDALPALVTSGPLMLLIAAVGVAGFVSIEWSDPGGRRRRWFAWILTCAGTAAAAASVVWLEARYDLAVGSSVHSVLSIVGAVAWSAAAGLATVWVGCRIATAVAGAVGAVGRLRGPAVVVALVPSVAATLVLTQPRHLTTGALASEPLDRVALATTDLISEAGAEPNDAGRPPSSHDGGDGPAATSGSRYTINECLEELAAPRPTTHARYRVERCSAEASPIEDVRCSLEGRFAPQDVEGALGAAVLAVCEARPERRADGLAGYLRTATMHEIRRGLGRRTRRDYNAALYYARWQPQPTEPMDPDCLEALKAVVAELDPTQQRVLLERSDGASWAEIAAWEGTRAATSRKRGERLNKQLRGKLEAICRS